MILVVAHRPPYAGNHNLDTNSLPSKTGRGFRGRPLLLPHLEFLLNRPETGKTVRSYTIITGILIGLHDLKRFQLHCDFLQHIKKLN